MGDSKVGVQSGLVVTPPLRNTDPMVRCLQIFSGLRSQTVWLCILAAGDEPAGPDPVDSFKTANLAPGHLCTAATYSEQILPSQTSLGGYITTTTIGGGGALDLACRNLRSARKPPPRGVITPDVRST